MLQLLIKEQIISEPDLKSGFATMMYHALGMMETCNYATESANKENILKKYAFLSIMLSSWNNVEDPSVSSKMQQNKKVFIVSSPPQ